MCLKCGCNLRENEVVMRGYTTAEWSDRDNAFLYTTDNDMEGECPKCGAKDFNNNLDTIAD